MPKKRVRTDKKVSTSEHKRAVSQPPLTKKRFMKLLTKAAQPVSEWQHGQECSGTSVSHPSGDYNDTHKNQDKTVGKED